MVQCRVRFGMILWLGSELGYALRVSVRLRVRLRVTVPSQ